MFKISCKINLIRDRLNIKANSLKCTECTASHLSALQLTDYELNEESAKSRSESIENTVRQLQNTEITILSLEKKEGLDKLLFSENINDYRYIALFDDSPKVGGIQFEKLTSCSAGETLKQVKLLDMQPLCHIVVRVLQENYLYKILSHVPFLADFMPPHLPEYTSIYEKFTFLDFNETGSARKGLVQNAKERPGLSELSQMVVRYVATEHSLLDESIPVKLVQSQESSTIAYQQFLRAIPKISLDFIFEDLRCGTIVCKGHLTQETLRFVDRSSFSLPSDVSDFLFKNSHRMFKEKCHEFGGHLSVIENYQQAVAEQLRLCKSLGLDLLVPSSYAPLTCENIQSTLTKVMAELKLNYDGEL